MRLCFAVACLAIVALVAVVTPMCALTPHPQFSHRLASFTTTLEGRSSGQKRNLALAAALIHGQVIEPGQPWSFVGTLGPMTPERGFVKSNAYLDGETRPAYGGGCCQLASTVYNAALLANLEIVARSRHIWPVRSVPEGLDAAINDETLDLRLRNPHPFPVRLRVSASGGRVVVTFAGAKRFPERVTVQRRVLETVAAPELVRTDDALPPGEFKRRRRGRRGVRVVVERTITTPDGAQRRETLSDDFYGPRNGIVAVGER